MKSIVCMFAVLMTGTVWAGMSKTTQVSGTVGDFSARLVTLTLDRDGERITLPRKYFKELKPGRKVTVNVDTRVFRKAIKHRSSAPLKDESLTFEPAPQISMAPR